MKSTNKYAFSIALFSATIALSSVGVAQEQFSIDGNDEVLFDYETGAPKTGTINGIPYMIIQGHAVAQGDMVLGKIFADDRITKPKPTDRGLGQKSGFDRWKDGIVPYQFQEGLSETARQRSNEAMLHWTTRTSIAFVERTPLNASQYPDYVNFEASSGCASWVGRIGQQQAIWVSDSCTAGSIIHEIGHAIGLFHEHTRPDRDSFITVNYDNIVSDRGFNFDKLESAGVDMLGDYDYGSIMHYGSNFFSNNGSPTIEAFNGQSIGQRNGLSDTDIASVNTMYQTDLSLAANATEVTVNDEGGTQTLAEVDINVSNFGQMGANTLHLTISMGGNAQWIEMITNGGWQCFKNGSDLNCTRERLSEQAQSNFTLLVDPQGASTNDLQVLLRSRTFDTDASNNNSNFSGSASGDLSASGEALSGNYVPALGGASGSSGSGGGAALWLLAMAFLARRSRIQA